MIIRQKNTIFLLIITQHSLGYCSMDYPKFFVSDQIRRTPLVYKGLYKLSPLNDLPDHRNDLPDHRNHQGTLGYRIHR